MKKNKKIIFIILAVLIAILFLIALAGMYKFNYLASKEGYDIDGNKVEIVDFETCKKAGYSILESYPAQCNDGKNHFVQEI